MNLFFKLTLIGLTLFILLIPYYSQGENTSLLIVEVQIAGDESGQDYIKLYNKSEDPVNVSGYQFKKKTSTGKDYSIRVFPADTIIQGKEYLKWGHADFFSKADIKSKTTLSKDNSIALFNTEQKKIDALGWGNGKDQYHQGKIFPYNPAPNQPLKRKEKDGNYQNTNSNQEDFYLMGEFKNNSTSDKIKDEPVLGSQTPNNYSFLNIILLGMGTAIINGIIIFKIST